MVIPTQQQAYSPSVGTSKIPAFKFSTVDPSPSEVNFDLYTGWVNTLTKAIWYLEGVVPFNGQMAAQWRAVGPIVTSTVNPTPSDYLYPLGQAWINSNNMSYWGLVSVINNVATWEDLSSGASTGILTLTGNVGGDISGDSNRNVNVVGASGQVLVTGDPGTNSLTISLAGGGTAIDSVEVDVSTAPGTDPVLPDGTGLIRVTGGQILAGSTPHVIQTNSVAANEYKIQIQRTAVAASSNASVNGVAHFNSNDFTVDTNGYISALSTSFNRLIDVDAHTAPGTDPVTPTVGGLITVTGGQVAAGTTANVIRTNSLAANTYTVQVQRSQAVASSTVGDNGVCHFDSGSFGVDGNGFVTLKGGTEAVDSIGVDTFTGPGTNPVLPNASGLITVTGGQVAAGTTANVIRTDSLAANNYTVQVQRSSAQASSIVGDNGVCHFYNAQFQVDSNGFVQFPSLVTITPFIFGSTTAGTATYAVQVARYQVVGNWVMINMNFEWTSHTGTGNMMIGGFPFVFAAAQSFYPSVCMLQNIAFPALTSWVVVDGVNNTTTAEVTACISGSPLSPVQMSAAGSLNVTAMYPYV